jgi:RHS repeat-associated protein
MSRTSRSLFFLIVLAITAGIASAQTPPATGTPAFGSFAGGPDVINLANLNDHWTIPVLHKPGRGMNFTYDLNYDSSVWYPLTSNGTTTWQPVQNWGWSAQTQGSTGFLEYSLTQSCNGSCTLTWSNYVYFDAFGTLHQFTGTITGQAGGGMGGGWTSGGGNFTSLAADGSGYSLYVSVTAVSGSFTWYSTLTTSSGVVTYPPSSYSQYPPTYPIQVTDRNGNQITVDTSGHFYDTLSSTTPVLTVAGTAPSNTTFTYTAPSGANASYTMKYTTYSIRTNFGCSNITDYGTNGTTTAYLVNEVDLPDISANPNDKYTFTYESTPGHSGFITGRLASVTLPTGGKITYVYTGGSSGNITCADGSTPGLQRYTPDTGSNYWNYARSGAAPATTTSITDPLGNNTVIQFQGIYEAQRDSYQGAVSSSNLLQTIKTCYNNHTTNCTTTAVTLPITQRNIFTVLPSGQQSEHDDFWNTYGGPTETDDYDYGAAPHGSLLKKILATYATLGSINGFRQSVTICNGTGTSPPCTGPSGNSTGIPVSQINYNYDEGTRTATSGTPQHISVSAPWGNQTSVNIYTSSGGYLTKSTTYYDTGNDNTTTDFNGGVTTFNYTSGAASCYNSFPTSIAEAIPTLSTSKTWNCTGGVQLTAVDENGQTTTTAYNDPYFWRPASLTDPTNAVFSHCYGLITNSICTLNSNQHESTVMFNSNNSTVDILTTLDGLGRLRVKQTRQGPGLSNFDSVETDYDQLGRVSRATVPYSGTASQTNSSVAATTTTYDAVGRPLTILDGGNGTTVYYYGQPGSQNNDVLVTRSPAPTWDSENTKRRQFEYDGLGRLTSVCEVTAGTMPWPGGNCAQNTPNTTGYLTKYTYDPMGNLLTVTQNAQAASSLQQSRSYVYDWMSRMISETVPEIGPTPTGNGTAYYTFDSDATCGTFMGDLVKRVDAAGNTICSAYDLLHRQKTVTYPSGIYSSVSPAKYFIYDSATINTSPNQTTMAYAKGRLAEAYTCFSPCTTKLTDLGLSYTARGETSDSYESTPNSSGFYYHISQSYWANRTLYQLNSNLGLPTTITHGLDAEGRTNTVSSSSGQNPVSGTIYNTASLPTAINLGSGSGDTDAYQYDSNTNRMTQYKFTVNGTSLTGALGWNANGTLQTQNITDGFNSADTQNCSYGYDDITRLTSANCGGAAAQTFSYDPFGNINKSGSPYQFQPTYSTSTNRITTIDSFTPTYDNNGNVTNDYFHTYTWDADGHPITIDAGQSDAVSVTYDAFGRMVEQKRGSTYTQITYSPTGQKLALMSGTTLQKAMVPLSGKALAVYDSNGISYFAHADMLGSIRLATTPTTRAMYFDTAYAPFGETYATSGTLDPAYTGQMNDTSHRQDTTGGLYDFPVREYSTQGRWPNPDPLGKSATCMKDPQSQNRYAYVRGNPITRIDPTGAQVCDPEDPLCFPCDQDPYSCFPPFPIFPTGGGGGGNLGNPRPFPWPLLPPGFFGVLSSRPSLISAGSRLSAFALSSVEPGPFGVGAVCTYTPTCVSACGDSEIIAIVINAPASTCEPFDQCSDFTISVGGRSFCTGLAVCIAQSVPGVCD